MAESQPIPSNPRFKSLLGQTFSKWTVLSYANARGPTHYWNCRCECGREKEVAGESLKRGLSICCRTCAHRVPMKKQFKHGMSETRTYSTWKGMVQRCHNPRCKAFSFYGARGIHVCHRWRSSFVNFLADVGERPSLAHQIERKNNNKGYSKSNCIWATTKMQSRNKRTTRWITYQGETLCIEDWAIRLGMVAVTVRHRLNRGWSVEDAFTKPIGWRPGMRQTN
jgi:hypothetical protein